MSADRRCTCMALYDPVLAPGEHHANCVLHYGVMQYRVEYDELPRSFWSNTETEILWDEDRAAAEEQAELHSRLGLTNVRIARRIFLEGQ